MKGSTCIPWELSQAFRVRGRRETHTVAISEPSDREGERNEDARSNCVIALEEIAHRKIIKRDNGAFFICVSLAKLTTMRLEDFDD